MAKIFIVEDDKELAEVIRIGLSSQGHAVQVANDGQEALDSLTVNKYDLIILD